jgi:hypothetical protein
MGLSQDMIRWITDRVREAQSIMDNPKSTESQRAVARLTLATWGVK